MGISVYIKKGLREFDLDVKWEAGNELVALFGYSGSGKTMTLKAISGLVTPDSGKVYLNGRPLFDSASGLNECPQKREVGFVFQDYALFPHMTVEENIAYGLNKHEKKNSKERIYEMLDLFHLKGLEKKNPTRLSGGQKQRVAFARALAVKPSVLLLDEPFSALDSMIRLEMRSVLKAMQRTFNIPVVLVTHDFPEVLELADKMIVYSDGKIQQTGTPSEIFLKPENEKVSELLSCWKRKDSFEISSDRLCYFDKGLKIKCEANHAA